MMALSVRFELKDEAAAAGFDALVTRTLPLIVSEEPGTLLYLVNTVDGAPLSRVFNEYYASPEAFDAHEQQPHVQAFLAERALYVKSYHVDRLTPTVGKGLIPGD
ncbi:antibiotic biosynthesis monooxygenase [Amycolatopsis alba DSM 44262]|uniref:Antibiotic biosynthesis monooxygenase n=2 Tax=Amycolatopsis alba TaxID=76020 RepID=A0A229R8T1_AMYAL|nr:antibiotic biosynthesis monooxygenase [Amycolatopsis alba DSM 44262]